MARPKPVSCVKETPLEELDKGLVGTVQARKPKALSAAAFYEKKQEDEDDTGVKLRIKPLIPLEWIKSAPWKQGGVAPDVKPKKDEHGPVPCKGVIDYMVDESIARILYEEPDLAVDHKEVNRLRKAMRIECSYRWKTLDKDERRKYEDHAQVDKERYKSEMKAWRSTHKATAGAMVQAVSSGREGADSRPLPAGHTQNVPATKGSSKLSPDKKNKASRAPLIWAERKRHELLGEVVEHKRRRKHVGGDNGDDMQQRVAGGEEVVGNVQVPGSSHVLQAAAKRKKTRAVLTGTKGAKSASKRNGLAGKPVDSESTGGSDDAENDTSDACEDTDSSEGEEDFEQDCKRQKRTTPTAEDFKERAKPKGNASKAQVQAKPHTSTVQTRAQPIGINKRTMRKAK